MPRRGKSAKQSKAKQSKAKQSKAKRHREVLRDNNRTTTTTLLGMIGSQSPKPLGALLAAAESSASPAPMIYHHTRGVLTAQHLVGDRHPRLTPPVTYTDHARTLTHCDCHARGVCPQAPSPHPARIIRASRLGAVSLKCFISPTSLLTHTHTRSCVAPGVLSTPPHVK